MADVSVRGARLVDVEALVQVQLRAWRALPADVWALPDLDDVDPAGVERSWERGVLLPPSPRHRLLVALSGETVVGVLAVTPADDPDLIHDASDNEAGYSDASVSATADELVLFVVDPDHRHNGHGSRLMAAAADLISAHGTSTLVTWVPASDDAARTYLAGAGWAADGAHRTVELADRFVRELRYETDVRAETA